MNLHCVRVHGECLHVLITFLHFSGSRVDLPFIFANGMCLVICLQQSSPRGNLCCTHHNPRGRLAKAMLARALSAFLLLHTPPRIFLKGPAPLAALCRLRKEKCFPREPARANKVRKENVGQAINDTAWLIHVYYSSFTTPETS